MWRAVSDWVNFSFKVWFAYLTAQALVLGMGLVGYVLVLLVLRLLGVL